MRHFLALAALACGLAMSSSAIAASCSDVLIDELGAFSDKGKVTTAAANFGNATMTQVRVRAIASRRGAKDMREFEHTYRATCPEWLQNNGKLKSNMLLFLYVDNKSSPQWVGLYYGDGLARLDNHYKTIVGDRFISRVESFRNGDKTALTPGIVQMFDDLKAVATRPVGGGGNTTIINTQPTDLTWLAWLAGGAVVLGIGVFVLFLVTRVREDRGDVQAAQEEAKVARSNCVERLNTINDSTNLVVLRANAQATNVSTADIDQYEKLGKEGNAALHRFDSANDDSNRKALSSSVYRAKQQRYEEIIIKYVEPAETLATKIANAIEGKEKTVTA